MLDQNKAIWAFLANFKYLNSKNKRSGFLLFGCGELTADIEKISGNLIGDLNKLAKTPMATADDKNKEFLLLVQVALAKVWECRLNRADETYHYKFFNGYMGSEPTVIDYVDKTAYSQGKFEKNLRAGILASQPHLSDELKSTSDITLNKMKNYIPETVVVRDCSYIP